MSEDQNQNINTSTAREAAEVAGKIETLTRRIRTRSAILSGEALAHGYGINPAQVTEWEAEQRAVLDDFASQLSYWEGVRDQHAASRPPAAAFASGTLEYVVPVDPMDDLQCDSCQ
jgi:DNA-binding transcriptional regulator YiaG